ncbi:MAG: acyl-CoA dehydrogenase family protein, partial [bacterium]
MDFELSEEQKQIKEEVRRFGENEVLPHAKEYDQEEKFPHKILEKA